MFPGASVRTFWLQGLRFPSAAFLSELPRAQERKLQVQGMSPLLGSEHPGLCTCACRPEGCVPSPNPGEVPAQIQPSGCGSTAPPPTCSSWEEVSGAVGKEKVFLGTPGWAQSVEHRFLISAQVMISGSWDRAPLRAPHSTWSA